MIIQGTTPTIKYYFKDISVSDIVDSYLTIQSDGVIVVDRNDFERGEDYLAWTLTQEETFSLGCKSFVMCNWLLSDGTRGSSVKKQLSVGDNLHDEVM